MYATTYLREIREMAFYAQASTIQVLEEAYHAAICLVLVLTSSANMYWDSVSCFAGATTRVMSNLTFQSCLENKSILWHKMKQMGLSCGRPEEEEKYDK